MNGHFYFYSYYCIRTLSRNFKRGIYMVKNFFSDMAIAKTAERTVLNVFSKIAPQYNFTDVSNDRRYFYRGDILTIAKDGREIGIEVKQDSRI